MSHKFSNIWQQRHTRDHIPQWKWICQWHISFGRVRQKFCATICYRLNYSS